MSGSRCAHGYTDDFWALSPLGQAVMITLRGAENPMRSEEVTAKLRYDRSLDPTLRSLHRRGFVEFTGIFEHTLTDAGRVAMGLPSSRPQLRVIEGGVDV